MGMVGNQGHIPGNGVEREEHCWEWAEMGAGGIFLREEKQRHVARGAYL